MYNTTIYILPEIIISVMACFILVLDLFLSKSKKILNYYLTLLTLFSVIFVSIYLVQYTRCTLFYGTFIFDFYSILFKLIIFISAVFIFLYSKKNMIYSNLFKSEFFVLCLLSILGMMIMISSGSFIMLYLGLELLALPLYALIIMNRSYISSEASMKYFIMGSIASGIFLFGVSLVYGMTGVVDFRLISRVILSEEVFSNMTLKYGVAFVIAGLVFKFGAVPFHMWVPDVYEGSPIIITMFIGTIPKIAALGMAYRLLVEAFDGLNSEIEFLFITVGLISLFLGNIFALTQIDLKRLLGYSAIAHVGFIFLGLAVSDLYDFGSVVFYVFIYVLSSLGTFGIIILLSSKEKEANMISDLNGLGLYHPLLGIIMMLFLLSLAGIPPTAGFFAKFFVIQSLISYGLIEIALFALLMSVLGSYYYLKVIKVIFFDNVQKKLTINGMSEMGFYFLLINGFLILFIGMFPETFLMISSIS
ncbi:MAG TPA: NADH-quinone oxidoreductase subunit N [Candidatus Azoamicus sp. OHIO2]